MLSMTITVPLHPYWSASQVRSSLALLMVVAGGQAQVGQGDVPKCHGVPLLCWPDRGELRRGAPGPHKNAELQAPPRRELKNGEWQGRTTTLTMTMVMVMVSDRGHDHVVLKQVKQLL